MTYKHPVKRGRGRHELIAATLRLIAQQGLHATTLRDIAADSRLSLGSTTYHFADRDSLMVGALEVHVADTEQLVDHAVTISREQRDVRADGGVHSVVAALLADRAQVIIRNELRLEATRNTAYREFHARSRDAIRRALADALLVDSRPTAAAVDQLAAALEDAAIEAAIDHRDPGTFTAAMTGQLDEMFANRIAG